MGAAADARNRSARLGVRSQLAVNPFYLVDASLIRTAGRAHLVAEVRRRSIVSISRPTVGLSASRINHSAVDVGAPVVTDGNPTRSDAEVNQLRQPLTTNERLQRIARYRF